MWKRCLFVLALTTGGAWAQETSKLRIGAWNIEWLGLPGMRSGPSRNVAQTPDDLAEVILATGSDVMALEEICVVARGDFERDCPSLRQTLKVVSERSGHPWKLALFPQKDDARKQWTGIIWNTARLQAVDGPWRVPVSTRSTQGFNLWKRTPHAMKFRSASGMTDFVLIPLHLKANHRDDPRDNPVLQRAQEMQALLKVVPQVRQRFGEKDVILLGDTNVESSREVAIRALAGAGFVNLNPKDFSTLWKGAGPFDRILPPAGQPEFKAARQSLFRPAGMSPRDFKIRCSDHYPVTLDMTLMADDD